MAISRFEKKLKEKYNVSEEQLDEILARLCRDKR